jgi:hypothetical protein
MQGPPEITHWQAVENVLRAHYFEPDLLAARLFYSAIAAHDLADGPPVWPLSIAPPSSGKTDLLEGLRGLPGFHFIDEMTPNTFLSGQLQDGPKNPVTAALAVSSSLLHRIGKSGILVCADFSTITEMKRDDRGRVLAALRRIYDGSYRREFGTSENLGEREWSARLTVAAAGTNEVERCYGVFQSLGERFLKIRWPRPAGVDAALRAMQQNRPAVQAAVRAAVHALFSGLPTTPIDASHDHQVQIAHLADFAVKARTASDTSDEIEGVPRYAQQLLQLAKGSARLARRAYVTAEDLRVVRRAVVDSIPPPRWQVLAYAQRTGKLYPPGLANATANRAIEQLRAAGLLDHMIAPSYAASVAELFATGGHAGQARNH